ncbi:RNA-directed DNA polymerase, eukaryota, Reverse transcriptase zinc-binding domain protein [Artemisia annua]|uniref:RNA-directed DNA polymerase, eukaryota, Reverse transcriptase zinc-binding domain protein n=1 Tax=Artemisia annua TaxID=35608 RepID=A0A2U1M436_ARTAN|nr:RNA-directed DNA polymerase, eukaryota, Reverse transcriptase zinc-binding domain protein [Artemisia annua]
MAKRSSKRQLKTPAWFADHEMNNMSQLKSSVVDESVTDDAKVTYGDEVEEIGGNDASRIGDMNNNNYEVNKTPVKYCGLDFARVLVEVEAVIGFKEKVIVQYKDNENKKKGTKEIKVEYDWKPTCCKECRVFGHNYKECTKRVRTVEELEEIRIANEVKAKESKAKDGKWQNVANGVHVKKTMGLKNGGNFGNVDKGGFMGQKRDFKKVNDKYDDRSGKNEKTQAQNGKNERQQAVERESRGYGSFKRSANKYDALEGHDEEERQELDLRKEKMVVDSYLIKKVLPTKEVLNSWPKDMAHYFKTQWEIDRNKEKEDPLDEIEEVMENTSEAGKMLSANEVQASWNIRSLNPKKKQKEVVNLIREENIQICAILETHVKPDKLSKVVQNVFGRWNWVSNISDSPKGCRILVGWDQNKVNLAVVNKSGQQILCGIETIKEKMRLFCSIVYAANHGKERKSLWNELEECVNAIEVDDICSSGLFFTWIKSPSNPNTSILKKLDRAMGNGECIDKYNHASAKYIPYLISDHSPVTSGCCCCKFYTAFLRPDGSFHEYIRTTILRILTEVETRIRLWCALAGKKTREVIVNNTLRPTIPSDCDPE